MPPRLLPAVRRAAGRPVRQPARRARAWARRRRPSSSTSTAASTASSSTSTSRRPKLRQNLAEHEAQVRAERRGDGARPRRARSTSTIDDLDRKDPDVDEVRRLFDFLEFRTPGRPAGRGARRRTSASAAAPAEVLEAEVTVVDDAGRGGRAARRGWPSGATARWRSPPAWAGGRRARRRSRAWRSSPTPTPARWRGCPADAARRRRRCATRSAALVGRAAAARWPPTTPRRCMRGAAAHVGVDVRALALDTADRRLPARPGRVALPARRAAAPLRQRSSCPPTAPAAEGQLDLDGDGRRRRRCATGPATRWPSTGWSSRCSARSTPRACASSTTRSRCRSCGCWPAWSTSASGVDADELRALQRPAHGRGASELRQADLGRRRRASSTSTPRRSCARSCSTSSACTPQKKTKTGYSTDAASLEKLRRPAPDHRAPAALPRGREAAVDLRRGPAGRGRRPTAASTPRSTRPWPAPAGCRPTSPTCTTSRCAARRAARSGGRSSRRRAASCWSPTTTRSSCAASPTSPRTRA